ncbi:MAG: LuxR C-terminal-related transcriptional regulator [Oscillochloridaceae bacterium umkhey_bin13]
MSTLDDYLSPRQRQQLAQARAFMSRLTSVEQQVIRLAAEGLGDDEIAHQAICSTYTIRRHIENITRKSQHFYGRRLAFRRQLVTHLVPYIFLQMA